MPRARAVSSPNTSGIANTNVAQPKPPTRLSAVAPINPTANRRGTARDGMARSSICSNVAGPP